MGKILDLKELQEAGGYIEGNHGSEGTKNLQIYTTESGKKSIYPNAESIPRTASIVLDTESGNITVNVPTKWKDDEEVKKYTDNYILTNISGNYKNNKDVEYQDPFDETKKIKTEEWIKKVNDALQFRVAALNATAPAKMELIPRYGGTESKDNVIKNMTTEDIIVMSANFDDDDSWVPLPAYMMLAYPQLEKLESYTDGWVKKNDYMENFYNIESGKITESNAKGIAETPEKMLAEIEDMTPEEAAKTIAFDRFIHQIDPKRSNWDQFLQAGDALSEGFYGGLYDWFIETSDMIVNFVGLSWLTGDTIETRDFWNGISSLGAGDKSFDATKYMENQMQDMALTNKDALSKAQAGYVQGRLAGQAVDAVVSTIAIGEATKLLSNAITTRITSKGTTTLADKMTKAATATSSSTALTTAEKAEASALADTIKNIKSFKNAAAGSANYQRFFSQTLSGALNLYNKTVAATSIALGAMDSAKFASIVNSASRIATAASVANTAVNVLGNMVIAAVVSNKELTTKVLSSKATSDEAKSWIQQVLWDTAKLSAFSYATNIAYETFGNPFEGSKAEAWARNMKQKASQKFTKFSEKVSSPWLNFMKWYNDNRAAAAKSATGAAANARAARGEAIKEAILANEARAYGANLSTEPGSYGTRLIEEALLETNTRPGVTMSETLQNLARAGVVFDPANLNLSEYEAWQANMAGFRNSLTNWEAIDVNISQVANEFTNPDIQPVISQQLSEVNKANSDMLDIEKAQGLLSKDEIKRNKNILKSNEGALYAMHSPQLARYIVRGYEMKIIGNEGRRLGHENLDEYKPYVEAKERWIKAAEGLAPRLREIADTRYVPALAKAEHNIMDIMMNDGVFPRAFVEAMRAGGRFGNDGEDWLRLVSRKDTPKGVYSPFSGTVKEDNILAINRFKVLDDEDITWPGNGLTELIEEYGVSRAEKTFLKEHKAATGKTTEIVVSGDKTRSAGLMKEFKDDLDTAIRQGIKSFVHTASGTVAIGKKRSAEQLAFLKEVADIGGVETIDIDALRVIMREKGVPLAETIVDQESLDRFLETASDEAKKILIDAVGEKFGDVLTSKITEEDFPNLMGNENFQKILRGELEKTSLQTGYGISDTRARLNAQVPGFDVLDWSLLGREHVNGLVPGGFYAGMDDNIVKAYITSVDDLIKLLGLPEEGPAAQLSSMGEKFWNHINTVDGNAVIPVSLRSSLGDRGILRFNPRGGKSMGNDIPDSGHLALYLEALKKRGITKVPIAISFNKTTLVGEARTRKFFDELDKAIATGKKPDLSEEDVFYALRGLMSKERVIKRIRNAVPEDVMSDKEIEDLVEKSKEQGLKKRSSVDDIDFDAQIKDVIDVSSRFQDVELRDITNDVQKAFSEYGKIPFYRGQVGMGDFYMNDESGTPQVGDAYWISPNASYTDRYGNGDKLAGNIPVEYILSDKAKNEFVRESYNKIKKYEGKMASAIKKASKQDKDLKSLIDAYPEYSNGRLANWKEEDSEWDSGFIDDVAERGWGKAVEVAEKALTKEQLEEYNELNRLLNFNNVTGANDIVESDKHVIKRYDELAKYLKKPVIDISEDNFAEGTAFFYYKGIDPKFDKEIGSQLQIQAKAVPAHGWDEKGLEKEMREWEGMSLSELIDDITMGNGLGDEWESTLEAYDDGEIDLGEVKQEFEKAVARITTRKPSVRKVIMKMWEWSPAAPDLKGIKIHYMDRNSLTPSPIIDGITATGFLREMGVKDPAGDVKVPAKDKKAWAAIDPRNVENVPAEPSFEQPKEVSYQDYERGLAEDAGLTETIYNSLKNEQYNKLAELKESNLDEYENLLDKLDRANSKANSEVKNSEEVQVAADQYRSNKKDFEKSVLFNQKFSYMIKSETAKNTLTAFANENGIKLEEGKASTKAKLKSALWKKVVNGEDLPAIKGIRKSDIKSIKDVLSAVNNDEEVAKSLKKNFYSMLENTDLFKNSGGPNPLKYELDKDNLLNDIDVAIDDMLARMKLDGGAEAAIRGMAEYQGYGMSEARFEFTALSHVLSKENSKDVSDIVSKLARTIVDNLIPHNSVIIKGNEAELYKQVEDAIMTKLKSRFSTAKTLLETMGEEAESPTITELLSEYAEEITGVKSDPLVIKTTDANGEVQYERVTPALADIYNARPTYSPMSTPMKILNNLALLKKVNQTDLNPRSFAKQTASDPAMAFVTVGALPGTLHALRDEITRRFGPALLRQIEKNDPIRFSNIKAIAEREGISMEKAFEINSEAIAKTQVPFTLLNNEILRQASVSKFGNEGAIKMGRKSLNEKINSGLRKASEKLGWAQNKRETYVRLYAGEKAFMDALRKGYNLEQAEKFREYALNTATTNFRTKHIMFNLLRSTTPYLTSGISGAKSFWQMFEMDPVGVTSRIFTGFIAPILYFAGEIFSDENLREKYRALSESEKENHIVIAIAGELILIPVGEEIGEYTNIIMHAVEALYDESQYDFWSLMLNDIVGLIPGADFTGFTDPEMWNDLSGQAPTFLEVMENGISKMLSSTAPPVVQSGIMLATGRDLYTGRKINNSYITIDEEGNPVIMSTSTSEFAQALAKIAGGDAKVIEKIVSGSVGTVALHTLDVLTSAVQYVASDGEKGSLTTVFDKTVSDLSAPFVANGYNALDRRFNYGVSKLYDKKESIEKDDRYIKYNQEIASEKDAKKRQTLINKRNELFAEYIKSVEEFIKGYRNAGGTLDKWKFSKAASLITFEDAIRSDRQFMDINTDYSDAYKQAMQTLYSMGITNPEGPSSLGYIYTDDDGKPQLKMWTPEQMQILQNQFYEQGKIHAARINAIIDSGKSDSLKKKRQIEGDAEQPYWDKYNSTGKLSDAEWDAIDDLRKAYNAEVVLELKEYMNTYGAVNVLSNDDVIEYLNGVIKVPSSYETVKGRYISSDNGKLDKQSGFAESYIKSIFGVR